MASPSWAGHTLPDSTESTEIELGHLPSNL